MPNKPQTDPGARVRSARKSCVRGITIKPAWAWSKEYRAWHRGLINAQAKPLPSKYLTQESL